MATYRLKRKMYGAIREFGGSVVGGAGDLMNSTTGKVGVGIGTGAMLGSTVGEALGVGGVTGALIAGAGGYAASGIVGRGLQNAGDSIRS